MNKTVKEIILFFGILFLLTGCQTKKSSTAENSTSSVTAKTESKSSDKSSSSEKGTSNSKLQIVEISAKEYEKKVSNKDCAGELIFFKTPGSKESDEALKKFSKQCQEIGEKVLYTVDESTEAGKKIIKKYEIIKTPYDAVLLIEGGIPMYLDLPNEETPTAVLKSLINGIKGN